MLLHQNKIIFLNINYVKKNHINISFDDIEPRRNNHLFLRIHVHHLLKNTTLDNKYCVNNIFNVLKDIIFICTRNEYRNQVKQYPCENKICIGLDPFSFVAKYKELYNEINAFLKEEKNIDVEEIKKNKVGFLSISKKQGNN